MVIITNNTGGHNSGYEHQADGPKMTKWQILKTWNGNFLTGIWSVSQICGHDIDVDINLFFIKILTKIL